MAEEFQVVGGVEFVARGRVELEKAELLRELRGELCAGRLEAVRESSLLRTTPTNVVPLPAQQRPSEIFLLLVLALWFFVGLVVFGVVFR